MPNSLTGSNSSNAQGDEFHPLYSDDDADITLRSSDGMLFNVHSLILRLASDVFAGMIAIPQDSTTKSEIVQLTEEANIICALLDSIYPRRTRPELSPYSFVTNLAVAADKYDITDVTDRIRESISKESVLLPDGALEKFALASRLGWDREARHASRFTTPPNTENTVEYRILETMDSITLLKLLSLHRRRYSMLASLSISYSTNTPEETRARQLHWELLSYDHAQSCRSQHHNRSVWAAFKMAALMELEKMSSAECLLGFRVGFWNDNRLAGLWDDNCTKCNMSFFAKDRFATEFTRVLQLFPTTID